ncbi:MAG TPA: hypothetical protein VKY74_08505 [Chloroflexia bacterium]|nr:hypothetical protein [Chloroflexia bacterium]
MAHNVTNTQSWAWECVGIHQGPAFLGAWEAQAYIAEQPKGWYAGAEGYKTGAEYIYRLPGRNAPSGPYPREHAERIARQMIGLAPDATVPPPDHLILYQIPGVPGREAREAKDVTGRRWTPSTGGPSHPCSICGVLITGGWSQGRWKDSYHHVCNEHVEVRNEVRPAES